VQDVFDLTGQPPEGWVHAIFDDGPYADDAEPVKHFETRSQPFFRASLPIVGLLIHATVGSLGGEGRRWRNRAGLAA
jgi:hypothetical protein